MEPFLIRKSQTKGIDTWIIIAVVAFVFFVVLAFCTCRRRKKPCNGCTKNSDCQNECSEWDPTMGECKCIDNECKFVPYPLVNLNYGNTVPQNTIVPSVTEDQNKYLEYETRMYGKQYIVKEKFIEDNGQVDSMLVDGGIEQKNRSHPDKLATSIVNDAKLLSSQPFSGKTNFVQF
jgi:hypothetical protein